MQFLMMVMYFEKKLVAKVGRKPCMSSTGVGSHAWVGCGVFENFAIAFVIQWPSEGSEAVMLDIGDDLLHEVSIHAFDVFTKQPRGAASRMALMAKLEPSSIGKQV